MCCVERNQGNVAIYTIGDSCCIHCIHCAVCFVVILADNYVELSLVGFDEGLHNFLAACLCEVTRLRVKNLPVLMILCHFIESIGTSDRCGCSYGTLDHKNVCILIAKVLCQPVSSCDTLVLCVGSYPCII